MSATLGSLLQAQAGALTGRERERAQLRRLLEADGPVRRNNVLGSYS